MDAFSYTDIFDTKGIEYLIVIAFLLLIIPTWILLNKPLKLKTHYAPEIKGINAGLLKVPHGLLFEKNHTWAFLEKAGTAKIGLDELLLQVTGGVSVEYLKKAGEPVDKGEVIASVRQDDKELEIASPISGKLKSLNQNLVNQQGSINQDPYGKGWLCKIEPAKWKMETAACLMAEEAEEWEKSELERLKDFFANTMKSVKSADLPTVVLQAGGELSGAVLADMPVDIWRKFQSEILD